MKKALALILGILCSVGLMSQDIKTVKLKTNDLIYVPAEDKIFVSVPPSEINGNSICIIDPYHGEVKDCYFIGGNPNTLALSNDGNSLFIGLNDLPQIVIFNVNNKSVQSIIQLGTDEHDTPLFAEDIAVLPDQVNSIAVARKKHGSSPRHAGVAIFDDGIMRPVTSTNYIINNSLAFAESNGRLFGFNNETSEFGLREIIIKDNGVENGTNNAGLISNYGSVISNQGNYFYSNQGERIRVIDSVLQLVGRYPMNTYSRTLIVPAPDSNVVYGIKGQYSHSFSMLTFDKTEYTIIDSVAIPDVMGSLYSIIQWGGSGKIAFNTEEYLTIIRNCTSLITDSLILSPDTLGACWGQLINLKAPDGFDKYYWSNGAQGQNVSLDRDIEINFYTADSLGCKSSRSNTVKVKFDNQPPTPYIYNDVSPPLCKGQVSTLSTYTSHSYLWSTGETSQEIKVDKSGTYTVFTFSNPGCKSMESYPYVINVIDYEIPDKPVIDVHGETEFCNGGSVILSIEGDYDIIQWSNGGSTNSIEAFHWDNYRVRVGSVMECLSVYSDPVSVRAIPIPPPPHILSNGNLLASSATVGNQWFHNGNAIQNADQQFYHATENGFYSVQVTIDGCTSTMSFLYNHFVVSTHENSENSHIKIFPNPTSNIINFITPEEINHKFQVIEVFDFTGNALLRFTDTNSISLNNLPNGLYIVRVSDKSGNTLKNELISKL